MQDHTNKAQDPTRARRPNSIHAVDAPRSPQANADTLREAQMSLVRAEQNLYNLVHANHNGAIGAAGFGYTPPAAFAAGFAPGFAPSVAGVPQSPGLAFGVPAGFSPWGTPQPALAGWPIAANLPAVASAIVAPAALAAGLVARTPACDISDEGKQFVCLLDLPGIRADQIELLCFEHAVTVNAYREVQGDTASLVQSERGTAALTRTITLPNEILPSGVKAALANGVLSIVLPKAQPTEGPRRVKVQG
ncbi:MAG: hypothetical protein QOJ26_1935 [Thermoplasmata archaeon]|jgi:HSP20 family protein|nr:hypothetical protein [Thermoplasmata archaeon]MEA3167051.1 hypothetical protein [Thermoplasmata archaeon]